MPEFRYTVVDSGGHHLSGLIEAENEEICRKIIAQRGLFCISIAPVSFASRSLSFGGGKRIKPKQLSVFCRQFSTMLNAGISIIKCLDILHDQTDKSKYKETLKSVYEGVQRGQALSAALNAQEGYFPEMMINMVEAGEASGTLDDVMNKLAETYEKSIKTANKIKSAMMYPIILGSLTVVVVIILMVFVLPVFIGMFESSGADLPAPTKLLMAFSNSLTGYWYLYLLAICAGWFLSITYLKNETGRLKWDQFKTTLPIVGKLNVTVISARMARTMSAMTQSGIPLLKSLDITAKVLGNKYFEMNLNNIKDEIKKGTPLSLAVRKTGIFPVMLQSMLTIGEESGTIDDVLEKTAAFYDEESDSAVTKMVGLLEPLMIIIMALVVGFIVVSIIMPIFGMMTLVQ